MRLSVSFGEIRPLPAIAGFCNRPNSDAYELPKSYINLRAGPRLLLDRFSLGFARIALVDRTTLIFSISICRDIFRYFSDVLGPEDVALVENVQKGLHSMSYNRGRFFVDPARSYYSEHAVHHLHGLVFQHLRPFIPDSVDI
jgi:hypothetical protein